MSNQKYIKSLCLLGSDRQQIDNNKLKSPLKELISEISNQESAEKILHALTLDYYFRAAATELPSLEKDITLSPITEAQSYASERYYEVLDKIINIEKQQPKTSLIISWIRKLTENNFIVHPKHLVKYLNLLLQTNKPIKQMAVVTLGKKGTWLCQQNPKYDKLIFLEEEDIWNFGTSQQRHDYLEKLLVNTPQLALNRLQENWESESSKEKLTHLKLLLKHPNDLLLDFVHELYSEEFAYFKKETVTHRKSRNTLAKFLLLHEQTNLHQSLVRQLRNYINNKRKGLLSKVLQSRDELLCIPETEDDFFNKKNMLESYGIDVQSSRATDFKNDQVYWFSELCSAIPFSTWTSLFNTKPKIILNEFLNAQKYEIFIENKKISGLQKSLVELASSLKEDAFTLALLNRITQKDTTLPLLCLLSTKAWESYLINNKDLIDNEVLKECPHTEQTTWSLPFSKDLLAFTVDRLDNKNNHYDYMIGQTIADRIHLDIENYLLKINNGNVQSSHLYGYWKNHIFDPIHQTITIKNSIQKL